MLATALVSVSSVAQYAWQEGGMPGRLDLGRDVHYKAEMQGSLSRGRTPLWLNANKQGLSSLDKDNGYLRGQVVRPVDNDSARRWGVGYGVDMAVAAGYTSRVVVQQAFAEVRWLHGQLSVGAKEYPMELKNQRLSSGAQALGINARPVPQVRLALPRYWTIPALGRWVHLKGHIAYGLMTDDGWQHDFTGMKSKYSDHVRYHSKAGYVKIGSEERFVPLSLELGFESAALFGGTSYTPDGNGVLSKIQNASGLKSYWRALIPGGGDAPEAGTAYQNEAGDILGSWLARLNYETDTWAIGLYADKFFEDHSSMFQLDYDGYGTGKDWNVKKKTRFRLYEFKDWMLGAELNVKYGKWLRGVVLEYLYSKYQSGPIYHDHSAGRSEHVGGEDNFYNHYIFTGWQHWGQVMGNPLYRSPLYNEDGTIEVKNNRSVAFHLGFDGQPTDRFGYRVLATWQEGLGTYSDPYDKKHHNVSLMVEANYRLPKGWCVQGAYGMDFGHILGANAGFQFTVSKSGIFSL
ncbi:hypothetical protein Prede_0347 [Prevotella dentalis DSM 3688]|uniref:Capsule assembly protein Wzi n=2 Tax=Prevotella dentalis TaxID=52227 RepID=F9D0Q0_PREDD|nr:hypothetical protein Prede_0347 [Prevotella dentalis DSM 3688]EGQ16579.1 hypothetical protein HMPREF9136_0428 [Prevotella dentalis DSM 3688]